MKNISKWLFGIVAMLSVVSIITALWKGEASLASYVLTNVEIIIYSLFLALYPDFLEDKEQE